MRLRVIAGTGFISAAIIAQSKTAMPFTPSHIEAVSADGLSYIGAHIDGGIQSRPVGYDKGEVAHELFLDLPATKEQDDIFNAFMLSKIGEPYDWHAIIGFIVPEHFHQINKAICSAVCTLGLRACNWLPFPVAAPAHLISPRDLLLMISSKIEIKEIQSVVEKPQ